VRETSRSCGFHFPDCGRLPAVADFIFRTARDFPQLRISLFRSAGDFPQLRIPFRTSALSGADALILVRRKLWSLRRTNRRINRRTKGHDRIFALSGTYNSSLTRKKEFVTLRGSQAVVNDSVDGLYHC
jgi:hypothetical protein